MENSKQKIVAGLLGIFLGAYGAHNFYLGYTKKAIIQLVCTLVGLVLSILFIGVFVVLGISIWALVEAIMIFTGKIATDANGNPLV
ncbi:MAG: TM2 domain-containing protein [Lachnospiraceae bacterium]|nr:TM2 domain-containing protein [Lachnospiraceae bacterium]